MVILIVTSWAACLPLEAAALRCPSHRRGGNGGDSWVATLSPRRPNSTVPPARWPLESLLMN